MDRMKTFRGYLLLFVAFYLVINILTYFVMRQTYEELSYTTVDFNSPVCIINETQTSYSNGYVKGYIINTTESMINSKYLRFEFFNEKGIYLGTIFKELKYFNVGEKQEFKIDYRFIGIDNVTVSLLDEQKERELSNAEKAFRTWWPVAKFITLMYSI